MSSRSASGGVPSRPDVGQPPAEPTGPESSTDSENFDEAQFDPRVGPRASSELAPPRQPAPVPRLPGLAEAMPLLFLGAAGVTVAGYLLLTHAALLLGRLPVAYLLLAIGIVAGIGGLAASFTAEDSLSRVERPEELESVDRNARQPSGVERSPSAPETHLGEPFGADPLGEPAAGPRPRGTMAASADETEGSAAPGALPTRGAVPDMPPLRLEEILAGLQAELVRPSARTGSDPGRPTPAAGPKLPDPKPGCAGCSGPLPELGTGFRCDTCGDRLCLRCEVRAAQEGEPGLCLPCSRLLGSRRTSPSEPKEGATSRVPSARRSRTAAAIP